MVQYHHIADGMQSVRQVTFRPPNSRPEGVAGLDDSDGDHLGDHRSAHSGCRSIPPQPAAALLAPPDGRLVLGPSNRLAALGTRPDTSLPVQRDVLDRRTIRRSSMARDHGVGRRPYRPGPHSFVRPAAVDRRSGGFHRVGAPRGRSLSPPACSRRASVSHRRGAGQVQQASQAPGHGPPGIVWAGPPVDPIVSGNSARRRSNRPCFAITRASPAPGSPPIRRTTCSPSARARRAARAETHAAGRRRRRPPASPRRGRARPR